MLKTRLCLINILFVLTRRLCLSRLADCDDAKHSVHGEGIVGQVGQFPWIGVLRVHIHEGRTTKIAVTGLVLVKEKYTIANADDITRIPRRAFHDDSKAMFIPKDNDPWYCKVKSYMTHPEYEYATYNTIAIVELALDDDEECPVKPICTPRKKYNTRNQLYALGFTDEHALLEKVLYKIQYVSETMCNEFYNRSGLIGYKQSPVHFQCGFAYNYKERCSWDNGMVLVSNVTGLWTLIGFGIGGPGCAAPSRFIDLSYYFSWIDSSTNLEQIPDYRKSFSLGFRKGGLVKVE